MGGEAAHAALLGGLGFFHRDEFVNIVELDAVQRLPVDDVGPIGRADVERTCRGSGSMCALVALVVSLQPHALAEHGIRGQVARANLRD